MLKKKKKKKFIFSISNYAISKRKKIGKEKERNELDDFWEDLRLDVFMIKYIKNIYSIISYKLALKSYKICQLMILLSELEKEMKFFGEHFRD